MPTTTFHNKGTWDARFFIYIWNFCINIKQRKKKLLTCAVRFVVRFVYLWFFFCLLFSVRCPQKPIHRPFEPLHHHQLNQKPTTTSFNQPPPTPPPTPPRISTHDALSHCHRSIAVESRASRHFGEELGDARPCLSAVGAKCHQQVFPGIR